MTKPLELAALDNLLAQVGHHQGAAGRPMSPRHASATKAGAGTGGGQGPHFIGQSPQIKAVEALLRRAAPSNITVLLQGESGTGKEVAARALHLDSGHADGPFVAYSCGAASPALIASELFGHEKGSFTGAVSTRCGVFERARGGTLFLDEITEMPLELQASLLRALETGIITRVGGDREIPVDLRIIAATNLDPMRCVEGGRLRLDLYFRLQVFPITMPPLRDRVQDIPLLAAHFLKLFAGRNGCSPRTLSAKSSARLLDHRWPGNVRELRNVMERACLLSDGSIEPAHLLLKLREPADLPRVREVVAQRRAGASLGRWRDAEQHVVMQTLAECRGNKSRAAAQLGISVKTLYNKLKRFGGTPFAAPPAGSAAAADGQADSRRLPSSSAL